MEKLLLSLALFLFQNYLLRAQYCSTSYATDILTDAPEPELDYDAVEMYPNPAGRELTLRYGDCVLHEIRLFAPDGRLVRAVTDPPARQTVLVLNDLAAGVYVVQCIAGRQSLAQKIVLRGG